MDAGNVKRSPLYFPTQNAFLVSSSAFCKDSLVLKTLFWVDLDKRTLSITYKNTLEVTRTKFQCFALHCFIYVQSDRVLARNLGGWDTFLTIKGQLASIDRGTVIPSCVSVVYA